MKRNVKLALALVAGLALAGGALAAYDWASYYDLSQSRTVSQVFFKNVNPQVKNTLTITHGVLDGGAGTVPISATLVVEEANGVTSMVLQTGEDANLDGKLSAGEWTTVASASISSVGSVTTATLAPFPVPANKDGYRILQVRTDDEELVDWVTRPGVDYEWEQ